MESNNKTFWIIVIVTLVTILTPLESKCVPIRDYFVARSLLQVFPPSESESPSPAPAPEVTEPANPPSDVESPAASSPENPADSISPADSQSEEIELVDSPAWSPDSPADSISPADSPSETDLDSPAPSPDSISPTNLPSQEIPMAPSGKSLAKNLLKQPLLSPAIKSICGQTGNAPLCESSVSPRLTPGFKPDTSSVLILAIQASINATKAAMTKIDKVASPDCVELYDDALTNFEDAINAIKAGDNPTVNTNLSAAMTDYVTCNDGFEESGEPNPLTDVSEKLTKMVSVCLALSTLLK